MEILTIKPIVPETFRVKRVAAYARVSSDKEAAEHSLHSQATVYEEMIKSRLDWQLVNVYVDEGITGTKNDRPAFQEMLRDCEAGKIDLIITKSITRFARNTVTLLETTRRLKNLQIDVYFEKENIHSLSPTGEMMLTLLAMFAEEESRSASESQKWKIKRRFEQGKPTYFRMYGYKMIEGRLEVVPEEAEIVKRIFSMYLSGKGRQTITRQLNRENNKIWGKRWSPTTVWKVLRNEKYTGDMMLQKWYRPDFRNKIDKINQGELRRYLVHGSHEPIIEKAEFEKVQTEINQRKGQYTCIPVKPTEHLYTGLLRCDHCGKPYVFKNTRQKSSGKSVPVWICSSLFYLGKDYCQNKQIPEAVMNKVTREVLGLPEDSPLSKEMLMEKIDHIMSLPDRYLGFVLKNGETRTLHWENVSRRYSWTPEMRQKAREKALARAAERRETR